MANIPPPPSEDSLYGNGVPPPPPETDIWNDTTLAGRDARYKVLNNGIVSTAKKLFTPPSMQEGLPKGPLGLAKQVGSQFMQGALSPMPGSLIGTPARAMEQNAQQAGYEVEQKTGSKLAGLGTSMALSPGTYLSAGMGAKATNKVGQAAADFAGEQGAKFASGGSNVPVKAIQKFFKDPMAIFKAGSPKEAGAILQKAKEIAGVTREEEFLIAKAADRGTGGARTVAESLRPRFEGMVKDQPLTNGELMALNRAAGKLAVEGSGSDKALWSGVLKKTQAEIQKIIPQVAQGLEEYSRAKTKSAFMSLFPLTKQGRADYFKSIGTLLSFGLNAPIAVGALTLGAKGASKLVGPASKLTGITLGATLNQPSLQALQKVRAELNAKK